MFFLGFHLIVESASVAELNHHDFEVLVLIDIITFHHMRGVTLHHHLGFGLSQSFPDFFHFWVRLCELDDGQVQNFDRHLFFGLVIHPPVDGTIASLPDSLINVVLIDCAVFEGLFLVAELLVSQLQQVFRHNL